MGAGYEYICDTCGYKVETSGPWEFYRDTEGQRKPYGHPVPMSQEAEEAGIKGFSINAYCPQCDRVRDVILVEFETPRDYHAAWAGCGRLPDDHQLTCGICGGRLCEYLPGKLSCPRCQKGTFKHTKFWKS